MEKFTEKPAVGARVTLRKAYGDLWNPSYSGESGVVIEHHEDDRYAGVRFDDGSKDYGLWTSLEPEATPAVAATPEPAPEITLNGHRYVLAPEQAEAKEEKREPRRGEIWRSAQDGLCLIGGDTDEDGDPYVTVLQGSDGYYGPELLDQMTYVYPSLAAAIQSGETFE